MFIARKRSGSGMMFFARKRSGSGMMFFVDKLPLDVAFLD